MHGLNLIALAIPGFFLLMGVEALVARALGRRLYRLNDSVNDLACGILQQVLGLFSRGLLVGVYVWVYQVARLTTLDAHSFWTFAGCLLGLDFLYYWFHRVSHESNLPWAAHVVHHQSEEYNLAVALRQSAFQPLLSWAFYLPLAVLGFPPLVFLTAASLDTLYQFWIHTRLIGRLGPLEWIFNTPSHHRVHHGQNPQYIDRNHAGIFIIWDRMFGTFEPEAEPVRYGITRPLSSWNPVWANLAPFARLVALTRQAPTVVDKVKIWLASPAWKPAWAVEPTPDAGGYDARPTRRLLIYAGVHFVGTLALTVGLLFAGPTLALPVKLGLSLLVAWALLDIGALFEGRRWVLPAELLRLMVVVAAAVLYVAPRGQPVILPVAAGAALVAAASAAWLLASRRQLGGGGPEAAAAG